MTSQCSDVLEEEFPLLLLPQSQSTKISQNHRQFDHRSSNEQQKRHNMIAAKKYYCIRNIRKMYLFWCITWLLLFGSHQVHCEEYIHEIEVSEGVPIGHQIGFIGDIPQAVGPPYFIVPVPGSSVDSALSIDYTTGEVRTKALLDRETIDSYSFVAILSNGTQIRVIVKVLDENDNAPVFPTPVMNIEFPENTPRDVKRTLNPARDLDLGRYNTQRYNIVSGNVNNAFRLSSHLERDGVLYLDLQINGFLDRETTPAYSLVIEALDGGTPPLRGQMTVNITIIDVNDNQPLFNQSRYFATIPENATIETSVLQVYATDTDAGENGMIEYSINRRQSDKEQMFRIDAHTGLITVNKALDFESKELHELVVVAKDNGVQPLETTTFVSIRVTDVNDNQPVINVIFLSDDATPKISESAQPGEFVARISVNDPDSKTEYSNVNVTLNGGDGHFGLTTRDNIIYLVIVSLPLDREVQPNYTLNVIATDTGNPPLHASKTIYLRVTDINDNVPQFEHEIYQANVMEVADPGTSVIQVVAIDRDEGNNSAIIYSLLDTPNTHSQWFQIDQHSGLITTRAHIDCETEPVPKLTIMAKDNGHPQLSSSATVLVTVHDVNDNEPIFDQSFYNVSVAENEAKGRCILKVSATDLDCGVNAIVNYTLGEGMKKLSDFEIRSDTGEVCISGDLDYETRNSYEFPIIATDRGGLSTTAIVKIQITDLNDNRPIFYPREYNVSLREASPSSESVVVIAASDPDSGRFGTVTYRIVAGNDAGIFRIDRGSGEIFVARPNMLSSRNQPYHRLNISAIDGGGLRTAQDAEVFISIIDSSQRPPIFDHTRYNFSVREDAKRNTIVGSVSATSSNSGSRGAVRYSIYSGDPNGFFNIDPVTGNIRVANLLDHETKSQVLLNIQATSGDPPSYGHTQVNIDIEDINDSVPTFESNTVRISVPENFELGMPLYVVSASDRDSGKSGTVTYRLSNGGSILSSNSNLVTSNSVSSMLTSNNLFNIDSQTGHLTLSQHLDFETSQRHTLTVVATDQGEPPLSSNLTIFVEVQDVNDNSPVFERNEYTIKVLESMPINSQILQVNAVDLDTGNNARLTYRLANAIINNPLNQQQKKNDKNLSDSEILDLFGIFPNSGWIYLRGTLDREARDRYDLTVLASDNGTPSATATARVIVNVMDANDNEPKFLRSTYEFSVEENLRRGAVVGVIQAKDADLDVNAAIRYSLIPSNTSFQINPVSGEIVTREPLDRELKASYDLVAEARDQGTPYRSARVSVHVIVSDVNDNSPEIVDPQEDVVSVREEQPAGTEVVRVRAIDRDNGHNATISYSILKGRDSDGYGYGMFSIDPVTGLIRTRVSLDHEEHTIYRLAVAATDGGKPPKQTTRVLRIEVLDLNDQRPTFTSSSLVFRVREDVPVGYVVGSVGVSEHSDSDNLISSNGGVHVTYTLTPLTNDVIPGAFDMDRNTGSLVVARKLDREKQSEFRLEIRALDISASNNPQSSAVTVKVEIADCNDNAPLWNNDPITIEIPEDTAIGTLIYNFTATDADTGSNSEIQYKLVKQVPSEENHDTFAVDPLTGGLTLLTSLDYEALAEYILIVAATDQSSNASVRLTTSVTARIMIIDINDHAPVFIQPTTKDTVVYLSDSATVGQLVTHVIAVDKDNGDNGLITYSIISGNEDGRFNIDTENGFIELAKPLIRKIESHSKTPNNHQNSVSNLISGKYNLVISASDHGTPSPKETKVNVKIIIQGSTNNPPRFLESVYYANITENVAVGSFVVRVNAKSFNIENGGNLTYEIPKGIADDCFTVDPLRGIVTTKGTFDRETKDLYTVPIYVMESMTSQFKSATVPNGNSGSNNNAKAGKLYKSQFDVATIVIRISDINDHAPEFRPGSCYALAIPENSETSVIHRVVATDLDEGPNGDITYSITGGNVGNKFSIDMHTGELTSRPLDRETHPRYLLQITAQDRGTPVTYQGQCNISIIVEDENDNDPRFEMAKYVASIAEDVTIGTSVLTVKAIDADLGINARITYSLANETEWLFKIDNRSGLITTAGFFDRERQHIYNFMVVATDGGRYDARSQRVPVQITIDDVNDQIPMFDKYPFAAQVGALVQPGQQLLQVTATDADQGTNGEIVYSLANDGVNSKFRINPTTGVLSATQSLASENGKLLHLEVIARDKGNPPQQATGLIELRVGDVPLNLPVLRFQKDIYNVTLMENTPAGHIVLQLNAVRSDGRRQSQKIIYAFGSGNEHEIFSIDTTSGEIRIQNAEKLDFEKYQQKNTVNNPSMSGSGIHLVVVARSEGAQSLYGYCEIYIQLKDENDNAPRFTQQHYNAAVWEGKSKGTFVMQVMAHDADQGANSRVLYHIVDGNHDNAFIIEPAFSGIVKTNIVLDREIREIYRLKVIATDEGVPQMTGTATISIHVVDINDNQPTFPPRSITVSEGTELGTVLTTVKANDVDTNPAITYSFLTGYHNNTDFEDANDIATTIFSIDKFSGKVILQKPLDYEERQEYQLRILASDTAHVAQTTLTIRVKDVNDNYPIFQQAAYHSSLPDETGNANIEILTVNATDVDSEKNALIRYSIKNSIQGFSIGEETGILYANLSKIQRPLKSDIQLTVIATDSGSPQLSSTTTVRIHINSRNHIKPHYLQHQYRTTINENTPRGTIVTKLLSIDSATADLNELNGIFFEIISGDDDGVFEVTYPESYLILTKPLDRETNDYYHLRIQMMEVGMQSQVLKEDNSSIINVFVSVEDANDEKPVFQSNKYDIELSESVPLKYSIMKIIAIDNDQPNTPNSEVVYDITSGNDFGSFTIDLVTGVLSVNKHLDYDTGMQNYTLIVRACDSAVVPHCSLQPLSISLKDENNHEPKFPVHEYLEFVGENEPVGVSVFTARATDLDAGEYGKVNYTILPSNGYSDGDDSWKNFKIDSITGIVVTNAIFDYEQRNRYVFDVRAMDVGGKSSNVKVKIMIDSRDEFSPQFTERTYRFVLGPTYNLPIGYVVGHVTATDRDRGPDGRVVYQLTTQHAYFKMNRTTGAVMIKKKLDSGVALESGRDISLVVTASSGRQGSLTNMTVVEIIFDPLADPGTNLASNMNNMNGDDSTGIAGWAVGLLLTILFIVLAFAAVFAFVHMKNRRHKHVAKTGINNEAVGNSNSYVDPSAFDTIPIRGSSSGTGQFAPPKYDEIPPYGPHTASSNSGAATTSELSASEQSGSSGRGSAEDDGEDEEIRMINEGLRDGIHDGRLSDVSVHNTQEYLARLGIVDTGATGNASNSSRRCSESMGLGSTKDSILHHPLPLHMFDEEPNDGDLTNLIYAKLNDVTGGSSDRASEADDAGTTAGSIGLGTTVDHVMMSNYSDVPVVVGQGPSMNGSLSSIVHSEEELTGSYNWDYLLDWGPQYQPLAHVFSEIARLKDDSMSVHSGASAASSAKSKQSALHIKHIPPLITNVAPRSVPVLSARGNMTHHPTAPNHFLLPRSTRSPISHDTTGVFNTSTAMSPSFSPSLSPLATRSPSISPHVSSGHHLVSLPRQQQPQPRKHQI